MSRNARKEAEKERKSIMKQSLIHKHQMMNFFERLEKSPGSLIPGKYSSRLSMMKPFMACPNFYKGSKTPAGNNISYETNSGSVLSFRTPGRKLSQPRSFVIKRHNPYGANSQAGKDSPPFKKIVPKVPQSGSKIFEKVYEFAEYDLRGRRGKPRK